MGVEKGRASRRPIMVLLELLGRRWLLRILWELREGPLAFGELQRRCDAMSPSVLAQRLEDLRDAGLVSVSEQGRYGLSAQAAELGELLLPLDAWARRWRRRSG